MISKPNEFRHSYVLAHDAAYEVLNEAQKGTHAAKGKLSAGRILWLKDSLSSESSGDPVTAYAEGIGLLSIDQASLSLARH